MASADTEPGDRIDAVRALHDGLARPDRTNVRTDAATLSTKLSGLCRRAGITRVADLTGLDRLGLPVVQAIRPRALSEVTSLGRGPSLCEARAGAIMESLERFYSERIDADRVFVTSADELRIEEGSFDSWVLPGRRDGWRRQRLPWIMALRVSDGEACPVPLELVHTRYTEPPPEGDGFFLRTTTGLACHTDVRAALRHGLLECIERDAIARAFAFHGFFDRHRLQLPPLREGSPDVIETLKVAGVAVAFWDAPSPTGIDVIWCQMIETKREAPVLALATEGYAAGLTVDAAMMGSLLEAVATRAGAISGAREDQTRPHYRTNPDSAIAEQARALIGDTRNAVPLYDHRHVKTTNPEDLLKAAESGLGPVLCVPVGGDIASGVTCVRVLLPRSLPFAVVR